jgi:murein DD-endopeptidase MepM/ murein hydrolase activator NlpD
MRSTSTSRQTNRVAAAADGVAHQVLEANSGGYGNLIWVNHGGGYVSIYAHLQSFSVSEGASVFHGTTVGISDNTGNSSGAHLHFAIRSGATTYSDGSAYKPEPMSGYSPFSGYGACGITSPTYSAASPVIGVGASSWSSSENQFCQA